MLVEPEHRHANDRAVEVVFARYRRTHDSTDREALVRRYLPLAGALATRYRHTSEPFDDLRQVASMGLLKAIDRYDPGRGTAFTSFAVPTILGELRRHFRDTTWMVRVPRELQELSARLDGVTAELERELGRAPTADEVAQRLGATSERVIEAREAAGAHWATSLDAPLTSTDGGASLAELVGAEDDALDAVDDAVTLELLAADTLDDREREILRLRFEEDLRQTDIGERLGISQMHVSRLIRRALERLQERVESAPA
jgi:RNA polymerase sigma-B factor